jgi:hypothetical protein
VGKIGVLGVLRLRAIKPFLCDKSAKRFAQDDGFIGGLEIRLVRYPSKKSQALRMTALFGKLAIWLVG